MDYGMDPSKREIRKLTKYKDEIRYMGQNNRDKTELNYGQDAKESYLQASGYNKDSGEKLIQRTFTTKN
uniref:Uncharacterized protein n=1 Tax=Romanomermis culicivorax TaxID=13658 RepID=A0A915HW59_ROMCU